MSKTTVRREDLSDQSLEQLKTEHRSLEQRLQRLNRPRSLSPEEQFEIQEIKKRKLKLKDRIRTIEG